MSQRKAQVSTQDDAYGQRPCMSRRAFLLSSGLGVTMVALEGISGWSPAAGQAQFALKADYPRLKVGSLGAMKVSQPVDFKYPYPSVSNLLVKLGVPAGGGVGPDADIVAFNLQCPHMGGPLHGAFKATHQVLGPCPMHLTTFDLSRHGMVVSGHATESLPQIVLEAVGADIYAVGVMGLVYGFATNVRNPRAV
ncbi:MAG TPA: arsenate reductase (azurin) small subunit [Methylomirabilota bacterium]|nr:arsenate reductase (azurin) small subunit [Methylomirabilota bacterium]